MNLKTYFISLILLTASLSVTATETPKGEFRLPKGITPADMLPGTIILKLKPEYRADASVNSIAINRLNDLFQTFGVTAVAKKFPAKTAPAAERNAAGLPMADLSLIYEIRYTSGEPVEKIVNAILKTGLVQYAEPKYIPRLLYNPNDPNTGLQYFLTRIQAYAAWDISKGDTNIVIGITDTGTDINHPDLEPNMKYNYADPIDGIDNDNDGYTDNFRGWDLGENDNDPSVNASNHGSHVSGCAAATTDNGSGVASPGFNSKFMAIKISNANGTLSEAYEGITYAADAGCQIINCSWGSASSSSFGQDVINYATINKNALVVAAAGNDNIEMEFFPAAYNYVLCVGSTGNNDGKSTFSNYGSYLDVCAPGSNIYTAMSNNAYGYMSGTSMASPVAAGCAAVVLAQNPTFNALQIGEQLRVTCDNIYTVPSNGIYQNKLGKGRVNLFRALTESGPSVRMSDIVTTDLNDNTFVIGDTIRLSGIITNYLAPTTNLDITLTTASPWVTIIDNNTIVGALGTMATTNNNTDPFTIKVNPATPQNTLVSLKLNFADGAYTDFQMVDVIVNVDYINITINQVYTTITSKGRLGYNGESQVEGLGFQYAGANLLYEAGLMIGQNATKVSDNVRGAPTTNNDFQSTAVVQRLIPSIQSEFDLFGRFGDTPAPSPLPVSVGHKAMAWSTPGNDKFVIVEYTIRNSGAANISNLWAGIFADWDIQDYNFNKADENTSLNMGYVYNSQTGGLWAGIKLLTATPFNHYAIDNVAGPGGVNMTDGYDDGEKYTTLSTSRASAGNTGGGNDVIDVVSSGPFTLAGGDSITVAFALIAGDDLSDINTSAVNAQIKYDEVTSINEPGDQNGSFIIYPNPVRDLVTIQTTISQIDEIEICDVSGRVIYRNDQPNVQNGIITIPFEKYSPGVYMIRIQNTGYSTISKFVKE